MWQNLHLIIHNVVSIGSAIVSLGLAFFVFTNSSKETASRAIATVFFGGAIFSISHVIGVNILDPVISQQVFIFNIVGVWIAAAQVQTVVAMLKQSKQKRVVVIGMYVLALILTVFFIIRPDLLFLPSVPKMYFPNYYVPGALSWIRIVVLFGIAVPYSAYLLVRGYYASTSVQDQNKYKFFFYTMVIGYGLSAVPNLLVYNIQVDPLIGMVFSMFCAIPMVYAAVKYELFEVKIIAKQAFLYSCFVAIFGALITLFNYSNEYIKEIAPTFPTWTTSLFTAVLMVTGAVIVWRKLREADLLKYEFITTVTHKFRTPLTHIKWASENLSSDTLTPEQKEQVNYIESANVSLVELTNLLMNVSEAETENYEYHMEVQDLSNVAQETLVRIENQFKAKNVHVSTNLAAGKFARFDTARIRFIIQTFLENAVHYSSDTPAINIMVVRDGADVRCSVTDNGIGIAAEELPRLFGKFYRGHRARLADTEGMGIGLFMAKEIIGHHRGRIWAESAGLGKGSTFSFTLKAVDTAHA